LAEAIDSVLQQTYRPYELIVVDDGSTDETPSVIARYQHQLRSIRLANSGTAAARNAGVGISQGSYVAFLDSDDIWHREKIARQVACLEAEPQYGLCIVAIQNFWIEELRAEREAFANHELSRPQPGYNLCSTLIRRKVFDRIGFFDEKLRMRNDREWFVKVRMMGIRTAVLPEVMVQRRIHFSNLTRRSAEQSMDELFAIASAAIARRNQLR
jgi:glycosyltransferase involved in cell wall biosynthesis